MPPRSRGTGRAPSDVVGRGDARRRSGVHGDRGRAVRLHGHGARPHAVVLRALHDGRGARRKPACSTSAAIIPCSSRHGSIRASRCRRPRPPSARSPRSSPGTRIENWDPAGQFVVLPLTDVLLFPPMDVFIRAAAWLLTAAVALVQFQPRPSSGGVTGNAAQRILAGRIGRIRAREPVPRPETTGNGRHPMLDPADSATSGRSSSRTRFCRTRAAEAGRVRLARLLRGASIPDRERRGRDGLDLVRPTPGRPGHPRRRGTAVLHRRGDGRPPPRGLGARRGNRGPDRCLGDVAHPEAWRHPPTVAALRNCPGRRLLVLGNHDVKDLELLRGAGFVDQHVAVLCATDPPLRAHPRPAPEGAADRDERARPPPRRSRSGRPVRQRQRRANRLRARPAGRGARGGRAEAVGIRPSRKIDEG